MDSRDLTTAQAEQMRDVIWRHVRYLERLRTRMERRKFPPNDELYVAASKTYDKARELVMRLHYVSCGHGVGESPKEPEKVKRRHGRPVEDP